MLGNDPINLVLLDVRTIQQANADLDVVQIGTDLTLVKPSRSPPRRTGNQHRVVGASVQCREDLLWHSLRLIRNNLCQPSALPASSVVNASNLPPVGVSMCRSMNFQSGNRNRCTSIAGMTCPSNCRPSAVVSTTLPWGYIANHPKTNAGMMTALLPLPFGVRKLTRINFRLASSNGWSVSHCQGYKLNPNSCSANSINPKSKSCEIVFCIPRLRPCPPPICKFF